MRKFIITVLTVFVSITALAANTTKLNRRQQALKESILAKWQQKPQCSAAKATGNVKASKTTSVTSSDDLINELWGFNSSANLDSIVYKQGELKMSKFILNHDSDKRVSQITLQEGQYQGTWTDLCRYDCQYEGSDITIVTNVYTGEGFTPSLRATYYAGNTDNYLKESYSGGTWTKYERASQEFNDKGNLTSEQLSVFTDGVEYVGYRITYTYENNVLAKVEFYENDGTALSLVETDIYTYGTDGKLEKITGNDWYEEYKYTDTDVECIEYSLSQSGSYYKSSIYVYAEKEGEYSAYKKESYNVNGTVIDGEYRAVESAENGKMLTVSDYMYDTDRKEYVRYNYNEVTYNEDKKIVEIVSKEVQSGVLQVLSRFVYSYLGDGRLKALLEYDSLDQLQNSTVYFYTDNGEEPTGVKSVSVEGPQQSEGCYDLLGRRVNDSYHGIVIVNGRKMLR